MKQRYKKSEEVKELEQLYTDYLASKYDKTPPFAIPKPKFRDDTTNGLTKCITAYCKIKGIFIERVANMGRMVGNKWIKGQGRNGTADLHAIHNGKPLKIEVKCKATKDRQSEAQKKYQQDVEDAGEVYIIVRDFKDFYNYLNS